MIRPLRPTDIVALSGLHAQAALLEVTSHIWPRVQPESDELSSVALLTYALTQSVDRRRVWVVEQQGRITGIIFGQSRSRGLVWDVQHLYAQEDRDACALLDFLCAQAVRAGARRVFLETPAGGRGAEIAARTGFERYCGATVYYRPAGAGRLDSPGLAGRIRDRADTHPLFQLYVASAPRRVRSAEALTFEEWVGLRRSRRRWPPFLFADSREYVWATDGRVAGWAELISGNRSQYLEMEVHPDHEDTVDIMLAFALAQTSPKLPLYARARDYQVALATALGRAGFSEVLEVELFVQQLAVRAPSPALVAAGVGQV